MGRKMKIQPAQVTDYLKRNGGTATTEEIASALECTPQTIRNKVKILRKDGERLLPTSKGIHISEKVETHDEAILTAQSGNWIMASMIGMALIANVSERPLLEAKKVLQKSLTLPERKTFRTMLVAFKNAIDFLEIEEEEFEPLQLGT